MLFKLTKSLVDMFAKFEKEQRIPMELAEVESPARTRKNTRMTFDVTKF